MIGIFGVKKMIKRLNQMIDNAIEGKPIENSFDETEMSALETKLSHYLTANNRTKGQLEEEKTKINGFISDISHQTKTPIANILLYTQLLSESDLSEQDKMCVEALMMQAEKLNFLVAALVKASRLETGMVAVTPKEAPVKVLIEVAITQVEAKAKAKTIQLVVKETDALAFFDKKWTIEALYNLIDNAVKYTPEGGSVEVEVVSYPLFCRIDIKDTGRGIKEEDIPKIFTRFYRAPEVSREEGVGIGLYLAREIITKQGGYIKVQSTCGEGATFSVFLPREG
ncbi:MAG: sensor histidine kinase [Cellulosilyticaceae bacterium]